VILIGLKAKSGEEPEEERKESLRVKATNINRKPEEVKKIVEKDNKITLKKRQTLEPELDPTEL